MKNKLTRLITDKKITTEDAFEIFDGLEPATLDFMIGRWKGSSVLSGHPLDGQLEHTGWYGKLFLNTEEVHPLLYYTNDRTAIYSANPTGLHTQTEDVEGGSTQRHEQTKEGKARLRNTVYRGRVSATMIYDERPILDIFVKIDEVTVLGVMDAKGDAGSFFFLLERDDLSPLKIEI